jgi:hypothetical protein
VRAPVVVIYDPSRPTDERVICKTRYGNYREATAIESGLQFDMVYREKGEEALARYAMRNADGFSRQVVPELS